MTAAAKLLVSIAGGALTSGAVSAAFGQTLAMQAQSTSGWYSVRYEIYDGPPVLYSSPPAGWTVDPSSGVLYAAPSNPTVPPATITLPGSASNAWGPIMLRLRANGNPLERNADGSLNASFDPTLSDENTLVYVPSPGLAMLGIGFNLSTQFDTLRSWVGALMDLARKVDIPSIAPLHTNHAGSPYTLLATQVVVHADASGGNIAYTMPANPPDGLPVKFKDETGSLGTNSLSITGATGQKIENPGALGTYTAAAGTITYSTKGGSLTLRWTQSVSTWLVV